MVISTTHLYLTSSELRFYIVSNPDHSLLEICNGENLWQWLRLKNGLTFFVGQPFQENNLWSSSSSYRNVSTHNEGKCVVSEGIIRTWRNKIYKYITSISTNVYIDELAGIVNECNNTFRSIIKVKLDNAK